MAINIVLLLSQLAICNDLQYHITETHDVYSDGNRAIYMQSRLRDNGEEESLIIFNIAMILHDKSKETLFYLKLFDDESCREISVLLEKLGRSRALAILQGALIVGNVYSTRATDDQTRQNMDDSDIYAAIELSLLYLYEFNDSNQHGITSGILSTDAEKYFDDDHLNISPVSLQHGKVLLKPFCYRAAINFYWPINLLLNDAIVNGSVRKEFRKSEWRE